MIDSIQIDNIGDELMTWQNFISFCIGFVSSLLVEHLVRKVRMPSLKLAKHISLCGYHRFAIKACNNSWFKQLHNAQITITLVSDFLDKTTSELIACEGNFGTLDKRILCRHNRFASCDINFSEERMAKMLRGAYLNVVFEGETKKGDKCIVSRNYYLSIDTKAYNYKNNSLYMEKDITEGTTPYIMKYAQCIGEKYYVMNT